METGVQHVNTSSGRQQSQTIASERLTKTVPNILYGMDASTQPNESALMKVQGWVYDILKGNRISTRLAMALSAANVIAGSAAEKKFLKLRDEWKSRRGHEPSTTKIILIPAYQKIIGMGQDAVALSCCVNSKSTWTTGFGGTDDDHGPKSGVRGNASGDAGPHGPGVASLGQATWLRVVRWPNRFTTSIFPGSRDSVSFEQASPRTTTALPSWPATSGGSGGQANMTPSCRPIIGP